MEKQFNDIVKEVTQSKEEGKKSKGSVNEGLPALGKMAMVLKVANSYPWKKIR